MNFTHKHVVVFIGLLEEGSQKRVIERKSTAWFVLDIEIAKYFAGLLENLLVVNAHNCTVEGLCGVSAHLRLVLELNIVLIQELGKSGRGEFLLGEIVKID